jgi:hypothetical protein
MSSTRAKIVGPEPEIPTARAPISRNALFQATQKDKKVKYDEEAWQYHRISSHIAAHKTLANCDASHFIHAAWLHRNYVLYQLLPEMDLVAS